MEYFLTGITTLILILLSIIGYFVMKLIRDHDKRLDENDKDIDTIKYNYLDRFGKLERQVDDKFARLHEKINPMWNDIAKLLERTKN